MESKASDHGSTGLKDKEPLLDLDFGKDFLLSSWKSMSMEETNTFDFHLTPSPQGKKKSYGFDKMNMDFNLDGDFGKISSFNVDVPDLDISSPLKKDGKLDEKGIESSGRIKESTLDDFTFSFDLDLLDKFDLGSAAVNTIGSNAQPGKDNKESSTSFRGFQAKEDSMQKNLVTNMSGTEGVSCIQEDERKKEDPWSTLAVENAVNLKFSGDSNEIPATAEKKSKVSSESAISSFELPSRNQSEISATTKLLGLLQNEASCPTVDAETVVSSFEAHGIVDSSCTAATKSKEEENLKFHPNEVTRLGKLQNLEVVEISEKMNSDKTLKAESHGVSRSEVKTTSERSSDTCSVKWALHDAAMKNQKDASTTLDSSASMSRYLDDSEKENGRGTKPSNLSSTTVVHSDGNKFLLNSLSTPKSVSLLPRTSSFNTQPSLAEGRREFEAIQIDRKLVSLQKNDLPPSKSKDEKMITGAAGSSSDKKVTGHALTQNDVVNPNSQEKNVKDLGFLLRGNAKEASQKSGNASAEEKNGPSFSSSLTAAVHSFSVNISKKELQKAGNNTPQSSYSATKIIAPAKEKQLPSVLCATKLSCLNIDPVKSSMQKAFKSMGGDLGISSRKTLPDRGHSPNSYCQTAEASVLSIKQKTLEDNAGSISLHLPKRSYQPPPSSRYYRESKRLCAEKVESERKNKEDDLDSSSSVINHEDKFKELEITFSVEDNSNIKQAEEYGKVLDDLCHMLRKKHDEAKDTLVRGIVNGNKLLLLNSPPLDGKISSAQKLLARLSLMQQQVE